MFYNQNIVELTLNNDNFRKVIYTTERMQLVLMCLRPGEEIGEEIHPSTDQLFRFVAGDGHSIIEGVEEAIKYNHLFIVAAGTRHNFKNTGSRDLKFYTIYGPPQHPRDTIHKTKEDAEKAEHNY